MNALVIGNGGREHAIAWKLKQSSKVDRVFCAPGNPNMKEAEVCRETDFDKLAAFARSYDVAITMVGPEAFLCDGIVDAFRQQGLPIVGPDKRAAQLEKSKVFAKDFMKRHGIPTAKYESFDLAEREQAHVYVDRVGVPVVVKADGLAAGKGVIVALSVEEAHAAVDQCFDGSFGQAGEKVLIEECLVGEEASILAITDGQTIKPLATSQDHKRVGEGDTGPNTGGMGAYSPAPVAEACMQEVHEQVLEPFLKGCQADALDYRGIIYAGIMVTENGPSVLEFNVRFGDPETQAILPRMSSDLFDLLCAVEQQKLVDFDLQWYPEPAACVVMAAGGYPAAYEKGNAITGISDAEATGALVFHAGTSRGEKGQVLTSGGRVLGVVALGETFARALENAYQGVEKINWKGAFFRRDIGHSVLENT
jgi:phosphoribosylamine--glycine ligase